MNVSDWARRSRLLLGNRVEYRRGILTEWYVNDERGLEQGFTLHGPPTVTSHNPDTEFIIELELSGDLAPTLADSGRAIEFVTSGGVRVLRYAALHVHDAAGRTLPARLQLEGSRLSIRVDATDAAFPITIDPLTTSPDWTAESDQDGAQFGNQVGTAGDVNGDGYSDVIVGAQYYDNGEDNEGRAYVYHGSSTGLSATPNWIVEGNQPGAAFGAWVGTAGDVNGDGYSDVVVGAIFYDHPETDEGRAFVYFGSPGGLSTTPAWTGESNQAGARYGGSVGTAGDVNSDGYSDIVVSAYDYDNGETDEGRTYVYLGSPNGPSLAPSWTAEGNATLAEFGVTAATAGDVNGDGYSDVIVGAWYLHDSGGTISGRAYVYHGSASGLSLTPNWTGEGSQASGVFGRQSGTAGDVNGDGYSDVIVGAQSAIGGTGQAYAYYGSTTGLSATPNWIVDSGQPDSKFGQSASTAGDVNGDGYADVIVGAHWYTGDQSGEGRVFVYYGSSGGLSRTANWTAEGNQNGAWFGYAAETAGDVNGDGYADMIIGSNLYDNGQTDEGRAFVFEGSAAGPGATPNWSADSNQSGASFGYSAGAAGDVNGDGYADVIVGAYEYDGGQTSEGRSFVYLGSASGLLPNPSWTAEGNQVSANYGQAVASAGDVNGDGYDDVIVGAPGYDSDQADDGTVYVYHGSPSGLSTSAGWTAEGTDAGAYLGFALGNAGDVDGDGYSDVVVGSRYSAIGGLGRAAVYHGSPLGLNTTPGWAVISDQAGSSFGAAVGMAGDVNGDGFSDVIVGAYQYTNDQAQEGRVYAYYGSGTGLATTPSWTAESDQAYSRFGWSAGSAGDINGDGYSDVIVGAEFYDNGQNDEGRVYVYLGSVAGLNADPAWTAEGNQNGARAGNAVGAAGDVDGDGFSDVLFTAPFYDGDQSDEGRAYIYNGSDTGLAGSPTWTVEGNQVNAWFGYAEGAGSAGDVNGDGYADVIIGAPYYDNGQTDEGRVFLYYGNSAAGLPMRPRQMRADGSVQIGLRGKSNSSSSFQIRLNGRMPLGREEVKLHWQAAPLGASFTSPTAVSGTNAVWTDVLTGSVVLSQNAVGLIQGTPYRWRVRLLYRPGNRLGQSASRWIQVPWDSWTEQDFRTPLGIACSPQSNVSDIMLVVDRSGSIADDNKLDDAKLAVTTFLSSTNAPPHQVGLVSFADTATLDQALTTNKASVVTATLALTATGGTRMDRGIRQARLELASANHIITHTKVIILMSDGLQNDPPGNSAVITETNQAKADGATIFTIGLGPDADAGLLRQMATDPNYYYFAPSGAELASIYQRISAVIACSDIGGQVYVDQNNNGLYNPGVDPPLPSVRITLTGPNTTDALTNNQSDGNYRFPANPSGLYTLTLDTNSLPYSYQASTPTAITLTLGSADKLDNNFGVRRLATMGGQVYVDQNNNGQYNLGIDTPMANTKVTLTGPINSQTLSTNQSDGNYRFSANPPGTYVLKLDASSLPFGYRPSTPSTLTVTLGSIDDLDNDFAVRYVITKAYFPALMRTFCGGPISDDFGNSASGWPVADNIYWTYGYSGGEYRMLSKRSAFGAVSRGDLASGPFIVEVDARRGSSATGSMGIVFGLNSNWSDFYTFEIYPSEQLWAIFHNTNGQWSLITYGASGAIQTWQLSNRLRLQTSSSGGYQAAFYVNGTYLTTIGLPLAPTDPRRTGLTASADSAGFDVRFDNYKLVLEGCPESITSGLQGARGMSTSTFESPFAKAWANR